MGKLSKLKKMRQQKIQHCLEITKRRKLGLTDKNIDPNTITQEQSREINLEKNTSKMMNKKSNPCDLTTSSSTAGFDATSTLYTEDNDHQLCISPACKEVKDKPNKNIGRRIVDISYFSKQILDICNHGPLGCSASSIILIGEKQIGLMSKFTFKCQMCNLKFVINSDDCEENYLNLNTCAVAGTVSIGCGQSQLAELLSAMNLPTVNPKVYDSNHTILSKHWSKQLLNEMLEAGKEEKEIAISKGNITKEGYGIIDVIADGCWSKRSYKKNYSALSGSATIIGKNTGKILYLGVKNKYCQQCEIALHENRDAKDHLCFKNYNGPSTAMESQIIVDGFKNSITEHGLVYGKLISDGDSSTYSKILQARPYENITVEKIECRNHVLRNFCNKFQSLATDTKYRLKDRKFIKKQTILTIRSVIIKAIRHHKTNSDIQLLFDDILRSHTHAFGDHTRCRNYFCKKVGVVEDEVSREFFFSSLWQKITFLVQGVAAHSRSLIHDSDSNIVENFHSVVAKLVGGKRINFSKKNSYQTRVQAAAVSFNSKKSLSRLYKSISGHSPKGKIKVLEENRIKRNILNKKYKKPKRRLFTSSEKQDKDYGVDCTKPDMDHESFEKIKQIFLENLKRSDDDLKKIQKDTILQSESGEWLQLRRSLLTASNFGKIIKRRNDTSCANIVKELLYKGSLSHVTSIKHGRENESKALMKLMEQTEKRIDKCGLFIDKELPFLGATPDGLSGEDEIIEVKCPLSAYEKGIDDAISNKKITFWKINKHGIKEINTTHNWYYQVQGQLHVTKRKRCIFAVWANENEPLKIEVIERDDNFWKQKMEEKLTKFYMDCLLPELVDARHPRKLQIRDPPYIKEAIEKRKKKE